MKISLTYETQITVTVDLATSTIESITVPQEIGGLSGVSGYRLDSRSICKVQEPGLGCCQDNPASPSLGVLPDAKRGNHPPRQYLPFCPNPPLPGRYQDRRPVASRWTPSQHPDASDTSGGSGTANCVETGLRMGIAVWQWEGGREGGEFKEIAA